MITKPTRILNFGAGVQSTALLLMMLEEEWPDRPTVAIFADTQDEPPHVYEHLAWCEAQIAGRMDLYCVTEGDLMASVLAQVEQGVRSASPPFFTSITGAPIRRTCTAEYKIKPIENKVRELWGIGPGERVPKDMRVEFWMGISLDEALRMKVNPRAWIQNVYPLVDRRLTRHDCLLWLERRGYPIPKKSACVKCPYRSNASWREMLDTDPASFNDAILFDNKIRPGRRGSRGQWYLHRSLIPLGEVDLSTPQERGQLDLFPIDLAGGFDAECDGVCDV